MLTAKLLCLAVIASAEPPASLAASASWSGDLRISAGMGGMVLPATKLRWLTDPHRFSALARFELGMDRLLEGVTATAELRHSPAGEDDYVSLRFSSLSLGMLYAWPGGNLWDRILPYVSVAAELSMMRFKQGGLGQSSLGLGLNAGAGLRVRVGPRTGSGVARLFGFLEGAYALRMKRSVRLEKNDEDDTLINGPGVRLGNVDLSGTTWTVGLGLAF